MDKVSEFEAIMKHLILLAIIASLTQAELTIPDVIDPEGTGWTIINTEKDGYYKQILIKTPFYEKDETNYQQEYYKRLLEPKQ